MRRHDCVRRLFFVNTETLECGYGVTAEKELDRVLWCSLVCQMRLVLGLPEQMEKGIGWLGAELDRNDAPVPAGHAHKQRSRMYCEKERQLRRSREGECLLCVMVGTRCIQSQSAHPPHSRPVVPFAETANKG